jgi:hypothetical protein
MSRVHVTIAAVAFLLTSATAINVASGHEDHGNFSAGQPGDPKKPARWLRRSLGTPAEGKPGA